ncbi:MAG: GGDEF domain-containing protein [Acidobacteriota bacterium]
MELRDNTWERGEIESSLIFRDVELESILGLLQDCPVNELQKGDTLIHLGRPNHLMYLLLSGRLRIHLKLTADPVAVLSPGEIVGELSLIDGQPTSAFVVADDQCRLLVINEKTLWSLIESTHVVARNLLLILSRRMRHGNTIILSAQQIERDYAHYAVFDAPTGLYNRHWVDKIFGRQVDRCQKSDTTISLLLLDIDGFKEYNEDHGRVAGDRVLHSVAVALRENMRPDEMIARYGEDEFIALLPEVDANTARALGNRVRQAVQQMQIYSLDQQPLPSVTITIAVTEMSSEERADDLLVRAEAALKAAQQAPPS